MNPPPWSDLVVLRLFYGRDRAVTIGTLQEQMGTSRRVIEKAIEEARATGAPICTGSDGVWLTSNPAELMEQYRALRRRYIRQAVNARHLLHTARLYDRNRAMTLGL